MDWRECYDYSRGFIGDGAIIAVGTVVTANVEPLAIVGNQPMRTLKYREREHYEKLDQQDKLINDSIQ
nr:hypothetical protein [Planktothrix prolifica]